MSIRPASFLLLSCCISFGINSPSNAQAAYCWDTLSKGMGVQDNSATFVAPSISADGTGRPWVTWSEHKTLKIRRWDGKKWQAMPSPGARDGAYDPVISIAASGEVFLAWRAFKDSQSKIFIGSWDGKKWKLLGEPLSAYPDAISDSNSATMLTDEKGWPVVAWGEVQQNKHRSVHVARWNGVNWTFMGRSVARNIDLYWPEPHIAMWRDRIWIVWTGGSSKQSHAQVARWDGRSWTDVGETGKGHLNRGNYVAGAQIVVSDDDRALVAWVDTTDTASTLALSRWTGNRWEALPSPIQGLDTLPFTRHPSLTLSADGAALLARTGADNKNNSDVSLQRLDGKTWQPLISSMHVVPGESNARSVKMVKGPGDQIYLAWDEAEQSQRIRVVRARPCRLGELPVSRSKRRRGRLSTR